MNRGALSTSIQCLELRKKVLVQELESVELDLRSQQAQFSRLVNEDALVYRLPNELFTRIFMMVGTTTKRPSRCTRTSPALLPSQVVASHVSHRWRDIALGTPLLWNTFSFRFLNGRTRTVPQLEAYLDRSGSCFLDINLNLQVSNDLSVCQLLVNHSRRWRRLSIMTMFDGIYEIREMLREAEAPILEYLSLVLGNPKSVSLSPRQQFTSVIPSILASSPPCLVSVRLSGQALGSLHPPTSSVTTLHLDGWTRQYMTHDQLKVILVGTPLLINLSLFQLCLHHPRDPLAIVEPTTLPFLRALRIRDPGSPVSQLMSLLDMPQLETITLETVETFDSPVMRTVQSLILDDCSFNEQDISKLMHSLPSVSDLSIDESLPNIFFMLSIPVPTEGITTQLPWPELQTIAIRDLQSIDVPLLCNMVLVRQTVGGSSPLRKMFLDRRSRTVLRGNRLAELNEKVIVENSDVYPPWRTDLQYEDADELLE